MRTDFFNEAIVTAILAASADTVELAPESESGEQLGQSNDLWDRLNMLLDRADKAAIQAGIPDDLVTVADFAVCAFIDEALLSFPLWRGRLNWVKKTLQFARHGTATAGEDFYRILDTLLEQAEKNAGVMQLSGAHLSTNALVREKNNSQDPLHAVLEIFALCLTQGFTGMLYASPQDVRDKLDKLSRHIPALGYCLELFFSAPANKEQKSGLLRAIVDVFRRFDLLDFLLWIAPPVLTVLFYSVCEERLNQLLKPFLKASGLP